MNIILQLALLAVGFVMLVKGSDWFVDGAASIAAKFRIPQIIIGLTIVAMGTSAPEAAVSITAASAGSADITVGNIVGSNIFNILFIVGLSAMIVPVPFAHAFRIDTVVAVIAGLVLLVFALQKKKLLRWHGLAMLALYVGYLSYLFTV